MAIDEQRLQVANSALASRIKGKTLSEITMAEYGGRIILRFSPLQNLDGLIEMSKILLTIDGSWLTIQKDDSTALQELPDRLQQEIAKETAGPKYIADCALQASNILRLYLNLGCLTVREAVIDANANLIIVMNEGVELHLFGYTDEKIDSDENSWLLEVEQVTTSTLRLTPLEYSFAGDQDGQLSGYWE